MSETRFEAMVVSETSDNQYTRTIEEQIIDQLPDGDVIIEVHYSSLNYKDALSASGNKGITRRYPHTPGIDAAGVIVESDDSKLRPGDEVIVTGFGLGSNTPGGFGQYIRVPADWVLKRPKNMSLRETMMYGTAGFTAALSVYTLEHAGILPHMGEILVTGATGGVGSFAVGILAKSEYSIVAATGKTDQIDFLERLGAKKIISRDEINDIPQKALMEERWIGVIDTVGGPILASAIKSTRYGGAIACCGNAASGDLKLTVYPFILRGVNLLGIESGRCPMSFREHLWELISSEWKLDNLENLVEECSLQQLDGKINQMLAGTLTGRILVNVRA